MAIDAIELARELNDLRARAAKKLVDEPLPIGRDATLRLQDEIRKHDLASHIVELDTDGYTVLPPGPSCTPTTAQSCRPPGPGSRSTAS